MPGRKAVLDQNPGVRNISLKEEEEDNDDDDDNDDGKNWKGKGDGLGVIPEDLEAPLHHCPCIQALLPPHCSHCESICRALLCALSVPGQVNSFVHRTYPSYENPRVHRSFLVLMRPFHWN